MGDTGFLRGLRNTVDIGPDGDDRRAGTPAGPPRAWNTRDAPFDGEVDETVGATVSIVKEVSVIVFPAFPAESVTVTVQLS